MDERIAIIYTTFLRDELMKRTLNSIFDNWQKRFLLLIGDQVQGELLSRIKQIFLAGLRKYPSFWKFLPFDCGVSAARNQLIDQAFRLGVKYCLLTADSIEFTPQTIANLDKAIQFLENHPEAGILGFDLKDRISWEYFMNIQDNHFLLKKNEIIEIDPATGLHIKHCDICRQFFLARIDTILAIKWDENLKTGEHEDFFWRYKQSGKKVFWTPDITGDYIDYKPDEYLKYRNRQYTEFREKLFKKYNLNDWVQYC